MFKYIERFPSVNELSVLVSFYNDIRDSILENENPRNALNAYIEEFPQYKAALENQFAEDEASGFPSEDEVAAEVLTPDNKELIEEVLREIDSMRIAAFA